MGQIAVVKADKLGKRDACFGKLLHKIGCNHVVVADNTVDFLLGNQIQDTVVNCHAAVLDILRGVPSDIRAVKAKPCFDNTFGESCIAEKALSVI